MTGLRVPVKLTVSHSAIADFQLCPRRWYNKRVLRLQRAGVAVNRALGFGDAFHKAQAVLWESGALDQAVTEWSAVSEALSWEDRIVGRALLIAYAAFYETDTEYRSTLLPVAERRITAPVYTVDGTVDADLELLAVLDVIVADSFCQSGVVDHKTTTSDLMSESFVARQQRSIQFPLYMYAMREVGRECSYTLIDAIRAPQMKRQLATPVEKREFYQRDGKWGNVGDPKPGTRLRDETVDEFEQRIIDDIAARPTAYFSRIKLTYTAADLERVSQDLAGWGKLMLFAAETGHAPRNLESCYAYNRECEFLALCTGRAAEGEYTVRPRRTDGNQ